MSQQKLTRREAAQFLGCSEKTLTRRAKEGVIPTYEDSLDRRKTLFDVRDLKKLLKQSQRGQNQ